MKKVVIALTLIVLATSFGCCTSPNNTKKNIGNCLARIVPPVKAILCPPNQAQVDQAAAAAAFLTSLIGKDYTAQIAVARQIFLDVAAKFCVTLDQLQSALDQFDAAVQVVQGQAMLRGANMMPQVPDVSALRATLRK